MVGGGGQKVTGWRIYVGCAGGGWGGSASDQAEVT